VGVYINVEEIGCSKIQQQAATGGNTRCYNGTCRQKGDTCCKQVRLGAEFSGQR